MTLASTLAAAHPVLQQQSAPYGEHYSISDEWRFPREDRNGVCWTPADWNTTNDDDKAWNAYAEADSQVKREECLFGSNASVCSVKLAWTEVNCEQSIADFDSFFGPNDAADTALTPATSAKKEKDESRPIGWRRGGWLPSFVVIPVLMAAWVWKMLAVATVWLPGYVAIFSIALVDWIIDVAVFLTFGWWCKPCAGLIIWPINLAMIPFMILGWIQRFWLETFSFVVDGWMLLFGFSGCYMRIGNHCYLNAKRKERNMYKKFDIPWFNTEV